MSDRCACCCSDSAETPSARIALDKSFFDPILKLLLISRELLSSELRGGKELLVALAGNGGAAVVSFFCSACLFFPFGIASREENACEREEFLAVGRRQFVDDGG